MAMAEANSNSGSNTPTRRRQVHTPESIPDEHPKSQAASDTRDSNNNNDDDKEPLSFSSRSPSPGHLRSHSQLGSSLKPNALSASFTSLTNLVTASASGSGAQLKERLSQLRQTAHDRAAGVIPKVECVAFLFMRVEIVGLTEDSSRTVVCFASFAPAAVPRLRRLQTVAVFIYELLMPICLFTFFIAWCVFLSSIRSTFTLTTGFSLDLVGGSAHSHLSGPSLLSTSSGSISSTLLPTTAVARAGGSEV